MPEKALSIAGYDPSGWAGVIADMKTFEALGVEGFSSVAALTAQNRAKVRSTLVVDSLFLKKEVETLLEEIRPDAVKIGMLGDAKNVRAVAEIIKRRRLDNVVLDTVFRSTSGRALLDERGVKEIAVLLRLSTVATPNMDEAGRIVHKKIKDLKDMQEAAIKIFSLGVRHVVVKGGHLDGKPIDVLFDGKEFTCFEGNKLRASARALHGTGCLFSSALAAGLAKGKTIKTAIREAKTHVEKTVRERESALTKG